MSASEISAESISPTLSDTIAERAGWSKRTVELNPRNLAHTGKEAISERTLVGSNRLDPTLGLDKVETSGKARDAMAVERTGLKARGPQSSGCSGSKLCTPVPPSGPRRHVNALCHGQTAGALGSHEPLVAGKAHDVEPHGLHIDMRRAGDCEASTITSAPAA